MPSGPPFVFLPHRANVGGGREGVGAGTLGQPLQSFPAWAPGSKPASARGPAPAAHLLGDWLACASGRIKWGRGARSDCLGFQTLWARALRALSAPGRSPPLFCFRTRSLSPASLRLLGPALLEERSIGPGLGASRVPEQAWRCGPGLLGEGCGVRTRAWGGARGLQEAAAAGARPRLGWGRDSRKRIPLRWPREPGVSEQAGGWLLSNTRGDGGRRRPGRPHPLPCCSPAPAPPSAPRPPRPSPAPAPPRSGQVEPGSGRALGPQAAATPPRLCLTQSLARPWRARNSSGRGGGTTETRPPRQRRPCRTRNWPWLASTCCSTTALGSRTSFSNNTGERRGPIPHLGTRTSDAARALSSPASPRSPSPLPFGH